MAQVLVVITAVVLCASFWMTFVAGDKTKLCFKGTEVEPSGNVTLSCPKGQVIIIDEALFGRNKWGACVKYDDDCTESTSIFQECDNLNNCSRSFKTYLTSCGYATILIISYTCLQVNPVSVYTTSAATSTIKMAEHPAPFQVPKTTKPTGLANTSGGNKLDETGLIAGCVVAAVVTVIALVIAITMVVRRLMQKDDSDDDDSIQSKNKFRCIFIDCSSCFTINKTTHQQRLKAEEKTSFSSALSKQGKKQASVKEMISIDKDRSLTRVAGEGIGLCLVPDAGYESMTMSTQALTAQDTTTNSQQDAEDIRKLDSNANSKINSSNAAEVYFNDGIENSPAMARVLNENIISGKSANKPSERNGDHPIGCQGEMQTSGIIENDHESENVNYPKFDAVSIPNTAHGTIC